MTESLPFVEIARIPLGELFHLVAKELCEKKVTLRDIKQVGYENVTQLLTEYIPILYDNIIREIDNDGYIEFVDLLANIGGADTAIGLADYFSINLECLVNSYLENTIDLTLIKNTSVFIEEIESLHPILSISYYHIKEYL